MSIESASKLLEEAQAAKEKNPRKAEEIYRRILETSAQAQAPPSEREQILRDQETALLKLGELFRDQKYVLFFTPCLLVF